MTTPLPQTPGDRRENQAQAVADTVAAIVGQAELVLVATVTALARRVAAGVMVPEVAQRRLAQTAGVVFNAAAPRIRAALDSGVAPGPDGGRLAQLLDQAVDTAITAAHDVLAAAIPAAKPGLGPAARRDSGRTLGSFLALSQIQAAQKVLDALGRQGLTGFVDRAGRRWDLTAYAEMATRTAVSKAWDDRQAHAAIRAGLDLVLVATHSTEGSCPQCLPWLGRTLSLTGATTGYPTLAAAKATGWRHPNCRCYWTSLGAGVAGDTISPVALDRAAAAYKASQRRRAVERQVRAAHRRTASAITPAARGSARRDLAAARAALAAHRRRAH